MSYLHLFEVVASAALVGVALLAVIVLVKFWPRPPDYHDRPYHHPAAARAATYRVPECGHRITAADPWELVIVHASHQNRCTIARKAEK